MMEESDSISGIADDTKPNPGRVYDYFLGGNHNFGVDRAVARQLIEVYPLLPKFLKMLRWFLGESIRRLLDDGFTQFLDFASGLPVQDHIHQIAPNGTKVIYSDKDPITVAYAQKIIGDNPNVHYFHCEAQRPEIILNSDVTKGVFDRNKKVAIGMSGISYFLPDEELTHALNALYDWANPGDKLFISEHDVVPEKILEETLNLGPKIFAQMGSPFFSRTQEKFLSLVPRWKVLEPGCQNFESWLNLEGFTNKDEYIQIDGPFYGVFFEKQGS